MFTRVLKDLKIDCSPHDFRSLFSSRCSDEGIDRELAERASLTRPTARLSSATPVAPCWSAGESS